MPALNSDIAVLNFSNFLWYFNNSEKVLKEVSEKTDCYTTHYINFKKPINIHCYWRSISSIYANIGTFAMWNTDNYNEVIHAR